MPPIPVKSPRRILILSGPSSGVLPLLKELTGTTPAPQPSYSSRSTSSSAGLTHSLALSNSYYTAEIPIWLDETTDPTSWAADFCSVDAGEVVRAVGAWVVVFRIDELDTADARVSVEGLLRAVKEVVGKAYEEKGGIDAWEGVLLCVGWPSTTVGHRNGESSEEEPGVDLTGSLKDARVLEEWEDTCLDYGFEFIDGRERGGRNATGELQGVERLKEALEANEWEDDDGDELGLLDEDEELGESHGNFEDEEHVGFAMERAEMEREFMGLNVGMSGLDGKEDEADEEAEQVEEFEKMMSKVMAIREMSAHLPKEERKKAAAKAVNALMKAP